MVDKSYLHWPFFTDEHRQLASELKAWADSSLETSSHFEDEYRATKELVGLLGKSGWLKQVVPQNYGGCHEKLCVRSLCLIREVLAQYMGLADAAFAMQGLGSYPITAFGSEELKQRYLPTVASGEAIAAFAISEAGAGSDVANLTTTGLKEGSDYILSGSKTWITNAGIANFYVVFARTEETPGAKGISAFVVDAECEGFTVSEKIKIMAPHAFGSLSLENCRVPAANMLGQPGEGFKVAMATLDLFRPTVGAAALGFSRKAFAHALNHAAKRDVFDRPLTSYQITQQKLADMAVAIDSSALLVYRAAWTKDQGADRITREAAMAKLVATEEAQQVIDTALQICGATGVVCGSTMEELYREIRPLRIYEGTTEIQKVILAREILESATTKRGG